jgi:nucleoside 2-deoxyribosyltransferase
MRLYMAGPLFTAAEQAYNAELGGELVMLGHEVWLPQERAPQQGSARAIFDSNLSGIVWCEAVVACIDGADADSGTSWEIGRASALVKPCILYRSDFRPAGDDKWVNLMLSQSASALIRCDGMTVRGTAITINLELGRT